MFKHSFFNDQGVALVAVLLVLILVFTLGVAVLSLGGTEKTISTNLVQGIQARYLAEAGIQMSLAELAKEPRWRAGLGEIVLGAGKIKGVEVKDLGATIELVSEAQVGKVTRHVVAEVLPPAVSFALTGGWGNRDGGLKLQISGNSEVEGDIVFKENVQVSSNSAVINGDLVAGNTVENRGTIRGNVFAGGPIINDGVITGEQRSGLPLCIPEPQGVSMEYYRENAGYILTGAEGFTLGPGELDDNLPGSEGILYVDGDLTIKGQGNESEYQGRVVLAVNGNIVLNCDLEPENENVNYLAIISEGDINLGSHSIKAFVHGGDTVTLNGGSLTGALLARELDIRGRVELYYDKVMIDALYEEMPPYYPELLTWKEY